MQKREFRAILKTLEDRFKNGEKKSRDWYIGFVEGLGNRSLTGYQIGALANLILPDDKADKETLV